MATAFKLVDFDLVERYLRQILAAVTFARTSSDALRVNVENQPSVSIYTGNNASAQMVNAALQLSPFTPSTWNIMDARETARINSEQQFANTRQRWTIT